MKDIDQFKTKETTKWKTSRGTTPTTKWKPGEVVEGCIVPKGWGEELIIENNEMYCGKLLKFNAGCKFSMHYHMVKDETWYVNEGEFIYRWIDTETAEVKTIKLYPGDVVRHIPGQPHQLEALTIGVVFEVSTQHKDSDSYRVMKGDEQGRKTKDVVGRRHNLNIIVKEPEVSDTIKKYIEDGIKEGLSETKKRKKK